MLVEGRVYLQLRYLWWCLLWRYVEQCVWLWSINFLVPEADMFRVVCGGIASAHNVSIFLVGGIPALSVSMNALIPFTVRILMSFAVLWIAFPNIGAQDAHAKDPYRYQVVDDLALQQKRVACGPNTLYMFLKSHSKSCRYKEVQTSLPMLPEGCTLLALRDSARQFGLNTRVLKCSGSDLKILNLPAIAHFHSSVFFGDNIKHYVLLIKVSEDRIEYVDGTSGWHEAITMMKFAAVSDGYVLEVIGESQVCWVSFMIPFGILVGGIAFLCRRSTEATRSTLTAIALFALVVDFGAREAVAHELLTSSTRALSAEDRWRAPEHDAINILDLYLKTINHAKPRETIARVLPKNQGASLAKLAQVASDLGVPLQVVRPAISGLKDLSFPLIVHMFDDKEQNGGFFLLVNYNDNSVQVVNAAVVTIESYSADEFRRRWSGYALVREEAKTSVVGTTGITLLGVVGYLIFRFSHVGCIEQGSAANAAH